MVVMQHTALNNGTSSVSMAALFHPNCSITSAMAGERISSEGRRWKWYGNISDEVGTFGKA